MRACESIGAGGPDATMHEYLLTIGAGGLSVHRLAREELRSVVGAQRVEDSGVGGQARRIFFWALPQPSQFCELKVPEKVYAVVLRVPTRDLGLPEGEAEAEAALAAAVVSSGGWAPALESWRAFAGAGGGEAAGAGVARGPRSFRVSGYRAGRLAAQLSSNGISEAVGEALAEARGWQVDLKGFELEVVVHINDDMLLVTVPLLERRAAPQANFALPGLAQPVAWAVARSANIAPGELVVDPMCGSGIILLEAAQCWRGAAYLGFDLDEAQLRRFAGNLRQLSRGHAISACRADVVRLPLPDGSVDAIVCDLPFGRQHGTMESVALLYPAAVAEFRRVLRSGSGRAVLLTSQANSEMLADIFARAPAE
ncbi:unnamed protein product [Prorocentrum cordatum]|uniref:THUMP domain-containing protein n=1 Tax=Prorocentrum cordatum TaxID=2364126 RepID=A0ABN9QD51_9DINO|nr:unnamed protein product [Polarella glacialis]